MPSKRIRVTKSQIKILVKEMERNPNLNSGTLKPDFTSAQRAKEWTELARKLNAEGGAEKSVEKWQKTWADHKCEVKKRYRDIKSQMEKTGGGSFFDKGITALEIRTLKLIGVDLVEELNISECVPKVELTSDDAASDQLPWEISQVNSLCQEQMADLTHTTASSQVFTPAPSQVFTLASSQVFTPASSQVFTPASSQVFTPASSQVFTPTSVVLGPFQEEKDGSVSNKSKPKEETSDNSKQLVEAQLATASAITEVAKALRTIADIQTKFLEIEDRKASAFEKIANHFCK